MIINMYDVVLLKNGLKAQIVEILKNGEMYVADVEECNGWDEDDTIFVSPDDINEVLITF
ncbi:MAG: hypothetical protein ACI4BI_01325 [Anaerotardibacter sp.]